jgi:hypothetical protein
LSDTLKEPSAPLWRRPEPPESGYIQAITAEEEFYSLVEMHPRNASTASQQLMPQSPSGISLNLTSIFDQRQMAAWLDRTNPTSQVDCGRVLPR